MFRLNNRNALAFPVIVVLFFVACGNEGSNSIDNNEGVTSIQSVREYDDLFVCSLNREGEKAYIETEKEVYECLGGEWKKQKEIGNVDTLIVVDSIDAFPVQSSSSFIDVSSSDESSSSMIFDSFVDQRDNKVYKIVKIGEQIWMAENLNYRVSNSYCCEDDDVNCPIYGRLYTWAAALGKTDEECSYPNNCVLSDGIIQGVCPQNWHLPSKKEYETLLLAVGGGATAGLALKSTSGWNQDIYYNTSGCGVDNFGFSALPAGWRSYVGECNAVGRTTSFWTTKECTNGKAYDFGLGAHKDDASLGCADKVSATSVRCVKD